jgi:hypothetical protein
MGRDRRGRLKWVALYYDPIESQAMVLPAQTNAYAAVPLLHYLYPVGPSLGIELYEMSMTLLGWSSPRISVRQLRGRRHPRRTAASRIYRESLGSYRAPVAVGRSRTDRADALGRSLAARSRGRTRGCQRICRGRNAIR